jgi:hypothetical protein
MVNGQVITEYQTDGLADDIRAAWNKIRDHAETATRTQAAGEADG